MASRSRLRRLACRRAESHAKGSPSTHVDRSGPACRLFFPGEERAESGRALHRAQVRDQAERCEARPRPGATLKEHHGRTERNRHAGIGHKLKAAERRSCRLYARFFLSIAAEISVMMRPTGNGSIKVINALKNGLL